ncbi:linear amide C-N hydrolase [Marinomonas mediterranea]|uniref:Choloylglycine hydrolase n=1 Tax=Marinomonas mediterranea (strain ATCC 700492 / JCM 21426 / NBRC 103028 / MMB-1) TaxID=717774 RepID=F2JXJ7_MARM1|nr:linear amide C-N hydrolase [Marinomonas mediterranea]ADZ91897.1 Choloylglycine hydrolase [Marinomonas mediterranea MMB-1]WCN17985.1 linear amide C-N hydrolase [Marinomonas mediterranea MMB-1]
MCTDFMLRTDNQFYVNGRSMTRSEELHSKLFFRKAGHEFKAKVRQYRAQYSWRSHYSFMGMSVLGQDAVVDGMNTEGLSGGAFWSSKSSLLSRNQSDDVLDNLDLLQWVLSQFSTCHQVIQALGKEAITDRSKNEFFEYLEHSNQSSLVASYAATQHGIDEVNALISDHCQMRFILYDQTGHSIAIECIEGKIRAYNNPVYLLPSPKQFIRTAFMNRLTVSPEVEQRVIEFNFHILNTFDFAKQVDDNGFSEEENHDIQWVVSKDLSNLIFSVSFRGADQMYSIDLRNVNWDAWNGIHYQPSLSLDSMPKSKRTAAYALT